MKKFLIIKLIQRFNKQQNAIINRLIHLMSVAPSLFTDRIYILCLLLDLEPSANRQLMLFCSVRVIGDFNLCFLRM